MMVAVLLGALTLGACVDDNESASVTKVREAKAAQLNAAAELSSAQAKAAVIAAEAEAKLTAAKAEYELACAKVKDAEAAEKEQAITEATARFAEELKKIQAEYASKIAEFNYLKAYYEKELFGQTEGYIAKVYSCYTNALGAVNTLTEEKLKQEVLKAKTEAQVITADEALKQQLASLNIQKAQVTRELAKWTALKEKQPSKDDYLKQMDDLVGQAYDLLQNKIPAATAATAAAEKAFNDAYDALENGEYPYIKACFDLEDFTEDNNLISFFDEAEIVLAEKEAEDFLDKTGNDPEGIDKFTVEYNTLKTGSAYQYATIKADEYFANALTAADTEIENAEGEEWSKDPDGNIEKDNSYDAATASVNAAKSALAYRQQEIAQKKKAIEAAQTDADKKQLQEELATLEKATDIAKLNADIAAAEERLAEAKQDKKDIEEAQKAYKANLAIVADAAELKKVEDAINALDPLAVAYVGKQYDGYLLEQAKEEIGIESISENDGVTQTTSKGEYGKVKDLLDGIVDVQALIDGCNTNLAEIEATMQLGNLNNLLQLQEQRVLIYNYTTGETEYVVVYNYVQIAEGDYSYEDAIALIEQKIKQLEAQILVKQTLAEKYKTELNTLLGLKDGETSEK